MKYNEADKVRILKNHETLKQQMLDNLKAQSKLREEGYIIRATSAGNKRQLIQYSPIQVGDKVLARGAKLKQSGLFTAPDGRNIHRIDVIVHPYIVGFHRPWIPQRRFNDDAEVICSICSHHTIVIRSQI